jgi:hypothetical protein
MNQWPFPAHCPVRNIVSEVAVCSSEIKRFSGGKSLFSAFSPSRVLTAIDDQLTPIIKCVDDVSPSSRRLFAKEVLFAILALMIFRPDSRLNLVGCLRFMI